MSAYATPSKLRVLHPDLELATDEAGEIDIARLAVELEAVSAFMDAYFAQAGFAVPLSDPPAWVELATVDLAACRLAQTSGESSDSLEQKRKDAMALLKSLSQTAGNSGGGTSTALPGSFGKPVAVIPTSVFAGRLSKVGAF